MKFITNLKSRLNNIYKFKSIAGDSFFLLHITGAFYGDTLSLNISFSHNTYTPVINDFIPNGIILYGILTIGAILGVNLILNSNSLFGVALVIP